MADTRAKKLLLQIFATAIPAVILIGLFLFSALLQKDTDLTKLDFIVLEQSGDLDTLSLQGSFNRALPEHETLWLYAENAEIALNIGGQVSHFNERGDTPAMFRSPGSGWFFVSSPGIAAGEPVEFIVRSYYGESHRATTNLLANLQLGNGIELFQRMLGGIDFFGMVAIIAVIAGVVFLMVGAVNILLGIVAEGKRLAFFGLFCLTGGTWCVTDMVYPYLPLMLSPSWAAAFLDLLSILLFPISLALIIRYYTRGKRTRQVMTAILLAEILLMVICLSLQLSGVADLTEQQLLMGSVAIPSIGVAMVCVALELKKYRDNYLLLLFLTVLPVFISNIVDGVNILYPFMPRRVLMQYSFAISTLLLTLQLVSYAKVQLAKAETMRRMEIDVLESRTAVMLSQIRPHFLYNALTAIKALCVKDPARAEDAMEHFSFFLRSNLDSLSDTRLIHFDKEISHVKDYFYLEKMRFQDRVNLVLDLEFRDFMLPPLTIQPLVENAVRYGITKKDGGGTVTIKSRWQDDTIQLMIQDDGVGFDMDAPNTDGRSHTGIKNVKSRLCLQCGGSLEINSNYGVGTEVRITLPRKEELLCE